VPANLTTLAGTNAGRITEDLCDAPLRTGTSPNPVVVFSDGKEPLALRPVEATTALADDACCGVEVLCATATR
jgi:hypothetical protein